MFCSLLVLPHIPNYLIFFDMSRLQSVVQHVRMLADSLSTLCMLYTVKTASEFRRCLLIRYLVESGLCLNNSQLLHSFFTV